MNCGTCDNDDGDDDDGGGGVGGRAMLVVVVEVVMGRVGRIGQGQMGMRRRMVGVDVVVVTESLVLFGSLIVSLGNYHTNLFIGNKRKKRRQIKVIRKG